MPTEQADHSALEVLAELEQRKAEWQRLDTLLRRLVGRLTHAADGRNAQLDQLLAALRREVREPVPEERFPTLLEQLTQAVAALDNEPSADAGRRPPPVAPPAPAAEPAASSSPAQPLEGLLLAVLDHLELGEVPAAELAGLRETINTHHDFDALLAADATLADLVSRYWQELEADRRRARELLSQVNGQLASISEFLDQDDASHRAAMDSRRQIDQHMLGEVQALGEQARQAPDLASLQADVEARLAAVSRHLTQLREREAAREKIWHQRAERMRGRIQELERNTLRMRESLDEKRQLADTDALTGLANRRALEARLTRLDAEPPAGATSLLILDIDHFKLINDRLGHAAGDKALRIVAEQLLAGLRPGDFLARFGGEEFVALLHADTAEAMQVAERLRQRIKATPFHSQQERVPVTLSGGVATLRAGERARELLERADQALYQAKNGGRDRCMAS